MAVIKNSEVKKMNAEEKKSKLESLRMELIKKHVQANKAGKVKTKEIKKAIARILTST
ncbi:MAG: 50S ribosomal protein L29 [Nanoarchaeota archaeon]